MIEKMRLTDPATDPASDLEFEMHNKINEVIDYINSQPKIVVKDEVPSKVNVNCGLHEPAVDDAGVYCKHCGGYGHVTWVTREGNSES